MSIAASSGERFHGIAGKAVAVNCMVASLRHMSIRAGVVVAVTFEQVDCAPDAKARAERDNERLEDAYCGLEKCHMKWNRNRRFCAAHKTR